MVIYPAVWIFDFIQIHKPLSGEDNGWLAGCPIRLIPCRGRLNLATAKHLHGL